MTTQQSAVVALIELFAASGWDELHLEIEGLQLFLSMDPHAPSRVAAAVVVGSPPPPVPLLRAQPKPATLQQVPAVTAAVEGPLPAHWVAVKAPNLGTFYRSPKPGTPPYVIEGSPVGTDSEICLLEVMKLFTAVRAGTAGTIRRICVADATLVQQGTVLFYIEPA